MAKNAIVTTTIFVPKLLDTYAEDAKKHGQDMLFIVVGDKKTPPETEEYCKGLQERSGYTVEYFSVERQEEYLSKWPALKEHIQWNCIMRRNVGILYAYELGCPSISTIDDDNFLACEDYIGTHSIGMELPVVEVTTSTNWINICKLLDEAHGRTFYHRGFPLEKREASETWTETKKTITPVVSAGLWLGDPDVDAMERLYHTTEPTDATKMNRDERFSPAPSTWTPFNSQNTALAHKVIPAYFLSPKVGRYDDIWGSYILKHVVDHMDDRIVYGQPLVKQERNPHNYWRDLDMERYGHALTLRFVETLESIKLTGKDYHTCYGEIVEQLPALLLARPELKDDEKAFLEGYFAGIRIWHDVFKTLV